jgi:hypothetical protein
MLLRMFKIHTKTGFWASNFDERDADDLKGLPTRPTPKTVASGLSGAFGGFGAFVCALRAQALRSPSEGTS